ncbi:TldD/PmbA family protein [Pelagibacterales bacterium SAG-MED15]|nr:TldD/PmbA family protein [Pelagibacterales bacterium SAG-MED15]
MLKEKEYLGNIAEQCISKSNKLGSTDVSVMVMHSVSEDVSVRNRKLDGSTRSENLGIRLTTYIGKKKSTISSSDLNTKNLDGLINRCIESTKITPEDDLNSLADKELYFKGDKDLDLYDETVLENKKKIEYINEAEEEAFSRKDIVNTNGSGFSQNKSNFILANSSGFSDGYKTSQFTAYCEVVSKNNGSMERDYEYSSKRFFNDILKPKQLGSKAAELALKKLNPKKIKSEKLNIIFDKRIAKGFLSSFSSAISSSSFSKGTTFLKDKLNKKIFGDKINIQDKADIKKANGSRYFDIEGVKTSPLDLVKDGALNDLLIDTYNGKKIKKKSNGRASGSSNLYFLNGDLSFEELLNSNKKLLYITETIGRGSNIITGDYSVGASGLMVENGEFSYPVSEITIAGNLNNIYKNISLANDLEFNYSTNSPTMLVEGMIVGGK